MPESVQPPAKPEPKAPTAPAKSLGLSKSQAAAVADVLDKINVLVNGISTVMERLQEMKLEWEKHIAEETQETIARNNQATAEDARREVRNRPLDHRHEKKI